MSNGQVAALCAAIVLSGTINKDSDAALLWYLICSLALGVLGGIAGRGWL